MTDSLRTRIATAIMQTCHGVYMDDAVNAADAVIRELGLRQEWGSLDDDDNGVLYDSLDEVKVYSHETLKTRYITQWVCPNPAGDEGVKESEKIQPQA